MNNQMITLIVFRLIAACIFAVGAYFLANAGKDGWIWFVFASIVLGSITLESK